MGGEVGVLSSGLIIGYFGVDWLLHAKVEGFHLAMLLHLHV